MVSISVCAECKGKGVYKIYNAYDPSFEEEIICEYCDGEGVLYQEEKRPRRKVGKNDDDFYN